MLYPRVAKIHQIKSRFAEKIRRSISLVTRSSLEGSAEFVEGILVIRIRYDDSLQSISRGHKRLRSLLLTLYHKAFEKHSDTASCAVVIEAHAELNDFGLVQAIMDLWHEVTDRGGRLVLVGYPSITMDGRPTLLPPLLPDFGVASELELGLRWVKRPASQIEGGDNWRSYPGMHRGRSFLPGEKDLMGCPPEELEQ